MKKLLFLGLLAFFLGCWESVEIENTEVAPHQIETKVDSYTYEELDIMHSAEGKTVKIFQEEKLSEYLEGGRTIVFNINKAEDGIWLNQTQKLEEMHTKFEDTFELVHLFVDEDKSLADLTEYIRTHNLASPSFHLENVRILTKMSDWNGKIPAKLIQNRLDGINLLYEETLSNEELLTILQVVTL